MKGYFIALKEAKILVKCEIEIKPASPHLLWNLDTYLNSKLCWPSSWKYMYLLSWHHFSDEIPLPKSRGGVFHWPFDSFSLRFSLYFTALTKWFQHHFLPLKISPNYHTHSFKRDNVITSPRPLLAWLPVAWLLGVATGTQLNHNI